MKEGERAERREKERKREKTRERVYEREIEGEKTHHLLSEYKLHTQA